ncbi:MAG: GNAT family N-acetyltransferase [Anaerolineae bacterium]|nr:MAG: GNAT family N-acetyltransferase [Anaerolineae bacterium]
MTTPTFEIIPNAEIPADVMAALDRYDDEAFVGNAMAAAYEWSTPEWRLILRWGGEIACQLSLFERECRVGGQVVRLGGVGSVVTRPEFRGRGLASIGMTAATEFFREKRPVDFVLLVCLPDLVTFYSDLGWHTVNDPVWVEHPPEGAVAMPEVQPMVMLLRAEVEWPGGEIEFMGLPW